MSNKHIIQLRCHWCSSIRQYKKYFTPQPTPDLNICLGTHLFWTTFSGIGDFVKKDLKTNIKLWKPNNRAKRSPLQTHTPSNEDL